MNRQRSLTTAGKRGPGKCGRKPERQEQLKSSDWRAIRTGQFARDHLALPPPVRSARQHGRIPRYPVLRTDAGTI